VPIPAGETDESLDVFSPGTVPLVLPDWSISSCDAQELKKNIVAKNNIAGIPIRFMMAKFNTGNATSPGQFARPFDGSSCSRKFNRDERG
jgi:hypothetical protein